MFEEGVVKYRLLSLVVIIALLVACSEDRPTGPVPQPGFPDLDKTPRPDAEAEMAALVVSGELVAPDSMYTRIHDDFLKIRGMLADTVPAVRIHYQSYWTPSVLIVKFDSTFFADTTLPRYREFQKLNAQYRLDSLSGSLDNWYVLEFHGRLHPARLIDAYKGIDGIISMGASVPPGDWPDVYISPIGDTMRYFFREAWGDCFVGCAYSRYHYVRVAGDKIRYVDAYEPTYGDSLTRPAWMDTMLVARLRKMALPHWPPR